MEEVMKVVEMTGETDVMIATIVTTVTEETGMIEIEDQQPKVARKERGTRGTEDLQEEMTTDTVAVAEPTTRPEAAAEMTTMTETAEIEVTEVTADLDHQETAEEEIVVATETTEIETTDAVAETVVIEVRVEAEETRPTTMVTDHQEEEAEVAVQEATEVIEAEEEDEEAIEETTDGMTDGTTTEEAVVSTDEEVVMAAITEEEVITVTKERLTNEPLTELSGHHLMSPILLGLSNLLNFYQKLLLL